MKPNLNLHIAEFVKSAASPEGFIDTDLPQIIFAGKSNVGKSSVINRILNRKNFARVGASPGKTIHINYFLIDQKAYFVDLPGYGYAKVSMSEKKRWAKLIETYLGRDEAFSLGIFIVDIRHKPTADDMVMAEWFINSGMPFYIVANKHDKLKKNQVEPAIELIADTFNVPKGIIIPFSAEKGTGKDDLVRIIQNTLEE
ncbi:MAG: YihA family ribosome biogenesis GTP-binding protein [Oscillospiraceae bacterium]|nr:YihA family ribosome biogenesis GTP-binding protein [Oscillospiraceae bacterium]MBQ4544756.1 YihA family ribosome biogenesis GTP-binding protein [Oscillospiraceae bacterium]